MTSLTLGTIATGLGCYGAYTHALKLDGGTVSYLTIAAPVVAAAAALIPPIAETVWRQGRWLKAILWWVVLVPAATVVFFASAERVHVAKAHAEAERAATRSAMERARDKLDEARRGTRKAYAALARVPTSERRKAAAKLAEEHEREAEVALKSVEAQVITAPPEAPEWLLPVSLDLIAFMAIWTGLTSSPPGGVGDRRSKGGRTKASSGATTKRGAGASKQGRRAVSRS